jgi:homeobox-leucine zipper protein
MAQEDVHLDDAAAKADPDRPKAAPAHHFFNPFTHSAAC